ILLLYTRPAAKRHSSSAEHGVSADIVIGVDDDDGCRLVSRHNHRRQTRSSCSDNDYIRCSVPSGLSLRGSAGESSRTDADGSALFDELSSARTKVLILTSHFFALGEVVHSNVHRGPHLQSTFLSNKYIGHRTTHHLTFDIQNRIAASLHLGKPYADVLQR